MVKAQTDTDLSLSTWHRFWSNLSARERMLLRGAAWCCGLALVWLVGIGPARHTLAQAEQNQVHLETQRQAMLNWRTEALALQAHTPIDRQTSLTALQTSVKTQLANKAELQIQSEHAILILQGVAPEVLLTWLEQARLNAHVLPAEAKLQRNASGQWEGRLTLNLPAS